MEPKRFIDQGINHGPKEFLKALGFKKLNRTFYRPREGTYQVIKMEGTWLTRKDSIYMDIELLVVVPLIHEIVTGRALAKNIGRWDVIAVCNRQLERLNFGQSSGSEAVSLKIRKRLEPEVIPFFENYGSEEKLFLIFKQGRPIPGSIIGNEDLFFAILLAKRGDVNEARQIFYRLRRENMNNQPYTEKLDGVISRLRL